MSKTGAEIIWVLGLVAWYVIRFPYERKAKRTAVRKSLRDLRERAILLIGFVGLLFVPAVYVATGFPALAWRGIVCLGAALWVFLRSHAELGRNWSISLEMRSHHRLVQTGVYRFVRPPTCFLFFLFVLGQ